MRRYTIFIFICTILFSIQKSFGQSYIITNGVADTTCTGTFYDTGGPSGDYSNNENITYTICPNSNNTLVVDFVYFNLRNNDYLTIYDGASVLDPLIGSYSQAPGPGTVIASSSNTSGCLTFVFTSSPIFTDGGWIANISCLLPCQDIIGSATFSPAPDADGVIRICQGETVDMFGTATYPQNNQNYPQSNATSVFEWNTENGPNQFGQNISSTFNNEGAYVVQLDIQDVNNCYNSIPISQEIHVSTTPDFSGTLASPDSICLGEQSVLTGDATPVTFNKTCVQPSFPPVALPDGSGVSYNTSVNLDCFNDNQTLTNINNLQSICVNMEHSYMGDLTIEIECPNGQSVTLHSNGGGSTYLGVPVDNDNLPLAQGIGYLYCWTPFATNGTWGANSASNSTLPAGDYESLGPLSNLVGCDLNGNWTLTVTDHLGSDNGFIFDWSLNFNPAIIPPGITFTPTINSENWLANPTIVSGTNPITVEPTTLGNECYTYEVTDNFSCTYDTTICVNAIAVPSLDPVADFDTCAAYTLPVITGTNLSGNESFYTGPSGTGTQYNAGDVVTVPISLYIYDNTGAPAMCEDETSFNIGLFANNTTLTAPNNLSANCSILEVPPYASLTDFENDGGSASSSSNMNIVPGTFTLVSEISDGMYCPETVTRTYSVKDDCGNVATATQLVIIHDQINPTGTAPADVTVQCIGDVPSVDITAITDEADNCTVNPVVAHVSDVSDGNTCPEVITRTYSITDTCGNSINVVQTITINDDINPTGTAPADVTVQCIGDVPTVDVNAITDEADNCTVNPTVTHVSDVSDGKSCPEIITRTYNISDDCGNNINVVQTITISDDTNPTGTAPADVTVQCIGDVPAVDVTAITDEVDNCTVNPIVTHVSDVSDGNTCPEIITRTYNIADDCGNNIDVIQTITINDDTNPTGTAPADVTVQCIGDVPAVDVTLITDEADNCTTTPTVSHVSDVSDGNTCPEIITRTYRIQDDCGNFTDLNQTITINDDTNPTGTAPADLTFQCVTDIPAPDVSLITDEADNCTVNPTVTHVSDVSDGNTCPEIITRTYNIADDCGNSINVTQNFIIYDDINPTGTAPADVTVQCIGDVPAVDITAITDEADNCTVNPVVAHVSDVSDGNTCPEVITRTYSITDTCGNSINVVQTITINDDINPTGSAPADVTVQCIGDVPTVDVNAITDEADNCTVNPTVTHVSDVSDGSSCPEIITRTYNIADDCGNNINVVQTITISDDTNPTGTAPADVTVQCIGDVPAVDVTAITDEADNCTVNPIVTHVSDVSDGNTCPEIITRTYNIADDCGNNIDVIQTITINDDTNPTGTAPADVTVQCIGDVPAVDVTLITDEADNCTTTPSVSHVSDVSDGNTCPEIITRTYRIQDDCGNFTDLNQIITINDDTNPTASNVFSTVDCIDNLPPVNIAVITDEADNCTTNPVVAFVSESSDNNVCNGEQITRVYSVTDDCGNSINVNHVITIDAYTPNFVVTPNNTTSCGGTDGLITISGLIPNKDYEISYDGGAPFLVTTNGAGEYTILGLPSDSYTNFTVTDASCIGCTNTENVSVNVNDPSSAVIDAGPDHVLCEGSTLVLNTVNPDNANLSWDNGAVEGGAGFVPPPGVTFYTVTAELVNCFSSDQIKVTVSPEITSISCPGDLTANCDISEQAPYADFNAFIAAGGSALIPSGGIIDSTSFQLLSEVSDGNSCPETVTRTYQISDTCGVAVTCTQDIVINDLILPTGTAPNDTTVTCPDDVPAVDVTLITDEADNCTVSPVVTHVSDVSDGNTCPETITRTYAITDDCGNTLNVTQLITINDLVNPTGTAPADLAFQCITDIPAPDVTEITDEADNCTVNPIVTHVSDVSDGNTCPELVTRTYNIADECGNSINVTQVFTINDTIDPTGAAPADVNVECLADVPAIDGTTVQNVNDNCTTTPTVTHVSDVSDGNTCPEVITRTYNIADDCGNNIDVVQTITVNDVTNPTASNPVDITVQCLSDVPPVNTTVVTDEADNCTVNPIVAFVSETSDGNTCNGEVITRVYSVTDDCGNSINVSHTITVDSYTPPAGFTLSSTDPTTCSGTEGTITLAGLTPSTNYQLSYDGGAPFPITSDAAGEYTIIGLTAGSYIDFTVYDEDCITCFSTVIATINLSDPNAPVIDAGPDQEHCEGTVVTLNAINPEGANISWDNGVTDGVGFVPPVGVSNYTVTAELANCYSSDVVSVLIHPLPPVDAGLDVDACIGEQVTLNGSGAVSYTWDKGVVDGVPFSQGIGIETYTVTGTSSFGCVNTDQVDVTIHDLPVISFEADTLTGCYPLEVDFTNLLQTPSDQCVFTINGNDLIGCDVTYSFDIVGCHDVTLQVESQYGCVNQATLTDYICIGEYPDADFTFSPDNLSSFDKTVEFTNTSTGSVTYDWDFGDGVGRSNLTNPEYTYGIEAEEVEAYSVELIAYSDYGCPDTISKAMPFIADLIYYIPNTFTPDGNTNNEVFKPVFYSGFDPQDFNMKIFNRWGEVIFESNDASIGWDGTYGASSNETVQQGTYIWEIEFKREKEKERVELSGHVNLIK
ncbi:HYR-like domain-containing protein [Brumimicrobium aurantiacum]|uniref:P/Homo B domain-containing protein n=1 Tax=Brumimicrobium aurantiacum TaxID=1737063 RepID=A0A3E1EVT9_9FLAO|nr:gliding motility-associated C-terminal domain-containing protein [Brumimicrobium aurantiacum]RFC53657.1 hypothetical protein DXU93_11040 [Brumimicrobium aurantiacum]